MAMLRRNGSSGGGNFRIVDAGSDEFREHFPALWEFLLSPVWPGSSEPREPGSMLVFVQDGYLKIRLLDPNSDEVAFWAFGGLWEALQGLDRALSEGSGDWRKQRPYKGQNKGKTGA